MRLAVLILFALSGTGCDCVGNCTAEAEPAVEITVADAETGLAAAAGASGTVTDGIFADALFGGGRDASCREVLLGGFERAGTYAVRITNAGYRPWSRAGVRVRGDACGPGTVRLTAELERL